MHGRKKSDLPQTKEEKDAVNAKISNYKKASRNRTGIIKSKSFFQTCSVNLCTAPVLFYAGFPFA